MTNEVKDAQKIDLSRRSLLKGAVAALIVGIAAPVLSLLPKASAASKATGGTNILIVYYSRTGNTREIANQIHEMVGRDIVELEVVEPYPVDYEAVKTRAKQELNSGLKPELKTQVEKIESYDVIFLGSPIWWGTIAAPVKTFLSEYDLSGKTILPFITHQGSGLGRSIEDLTGPCPNSTILDGLAVWGRNAKSAQNDVSEWLHRLGMKK